jgi:RND family efflux transporter MFP subunit
MDRLADELKKLSIPRNPGPRASWVGIAIAGAIVLVAAGAAAAWQRGAFSGPPADPAVEQEPKSFSIATPPPPSEFSASGYVVPIRRATLGSKSAGRLVEFDVREGDAIRAGGILARLDDKELAAERARLATEHENLARQLERRRELLAKAFVSREEFEALQAGVRSAAAALELADARLAETRIVAPFDAVVLERHAELGDMIHASKNIVTIADVSARFAEVDVAESQIGRVGVGQRARIALDASPGRSYEGRVAQVFPSALRAKGTVRVRVRFDAPDEAARIDLTVRVAFIENGE